MQNGDQDRLSRIRQTLRQLAGEVQQLTSIFADRRPMVKGTVYELKRRCGKPTCGCATGEGHSSMVLSRSEGGRTKLHVIAPGRLKELQTLTRRYQRFRRARARLGQIHKKMLSLVDQLERARRQEP